MAEEKKVVIYPEGGTNPNFPNCIAPSDKDLRGDNLQSWHRNAARVSSNDPIKPLKSAKFPPKRSADRQEEQGMGKE